MVRRESPLLLRSSVPAVTDPRLKFAQIKPGLGDPGPYCNCSAQPDLISNNFVTLLVSMQYLLILCSQYCKDKPISSHRYTSEQHQLTVNKPVELSLQPAKLVRPNLEGKLNPVEPQHARSNEVEAESDDDEKELLEEILANLQKQKRDSTTTVTTSSTTRRLAISANASLRACPSRASRAASSIPIGRTWSATACRKACGNSPSAPRVSTTVPPSRRSSASTLVSRSRSIG